MMSIPPSEFFDQIKHHHQNIDDNFEQPSMIISKLRAYQRQAVKWMIDRENNNDLVKSDCSPFSGGILADQSGLGKTLEMLCCIVVNTPPSELYSEKTMLENFKVVPGNTSIEISSKMCRQIQISECVPLQKEPNLSAICQNLNDIMKWCKATLIVVPLSNMDHWILEMTVHIAKPGIKVFVYNGFQLDGFIHPNLFSDYDVVITSHENLLKELNYGWKNRNTSSFRHPKKYNYPQSPLSLIKWWRICLDQGQAMKSKINKLFQSMSCLKSVHKWSITCTPIQKSLYDLYGNLKFLDIDPYYKREQFLGLMKNETDIIYEWFSKVIWQNSMKDFELNLPKLTYEKHWLIFSENEKYFYQHQHDFYAEHFSRPVTRAYENFDILLKNIDNKSMNYLNESLKRVKQACWHPQAICSNVLKEKSTMPMKEIIDAILKNCHNECNDYLHSLLTKLNYLADIYHYLSESAIAVKYYRDVLNLIELYKDKPLKTHTYKKLHSLYNLAGILAKHSELSHSLNDLDLKNSIELLEKECLDSSKQKIISTCKTVQLHSNQIKKLLNEKQLSYSNWWLDTLKLVSSPKEFINKIRGELEDYHVSSDINIANKLNSVNDIKNVLSIWLKELNMSRIKIISILKVLEETPMDGLVKTARVCNSSHDCTKCVLLIHDSKNCCFICQASSLLKMYESLLFCVSNKQTSISIDNIPEKDDNITSKSTHEGSLKISQNEFLLLKLFEYGKNKILDNNFFKDATEHMNILHLIREEFVYLRLLCTYFNDNRCAHFEVAMAKVIPSQINLQFESDVNEPSMKKTKLNFFNENDVNFEINSLKTSIQYKKCELENAITTLLYLQKLKNKENSTEPELCPICILNMNSGWAVIPCGHFVCFKCVVEIGSRSYGLVSCPLCRHQCFMRSIYYAKSNQEDEIPSIVIKGSFFTKIKFITIKLMELIAQDPKVKVLVFSSSAYELQKLEEALKLNSVNHRLLHPCKKYKQDIESNILKSKYEPNLVKRRSMYSKQKYYEPLVDFKTNAELNVLLMTLCQASTELSLTEATRVFFMEPMINKDDQNVAIGQINRIGQTKPIFVHHFIFRDSIEENIINMFPIDQPKEWGDITLSQMITVFKRNQTSDP